MYKLLYNNLICLYLLVSRYSQPYILKLENLIWVFTYYMSSCFRWCYVAKRSFLRRCLYSPSSKLSLWVWVSVLWPVLNKGHCRKYLRVVCLTLSNGGSCNIGLFRSSNSCSAECFTDYNVIDDASALPPILHGQLLWLPDCPYLFKKNYRF